MKYIYFACAGIPHENEKVFFTSRNRLQSKNAAFNHRNDQEKRYRIPAPVFREFFTFNRSTGQYETKLTYWDIEPLNIGDAGTGKRYGSNLPVKRYWLSVYNSECWSVPIFSYSYEGTIEQARENCALWIEKLEIDGLTGGLRKLETRENYNGNKL